MSFLFAQCRRPVVLHTFSSFLRTKSSAFGPYRTGDQPVDDLGFLTWFLGFLGSLLVHLSSILNLGSDKLENT